MRSIQRAALVGCSLLLRAPLAIWNGEGLPHVRWYAFPLLITHSLVQGTMVHVGPDP